MTKEFVSYEQALSLKELGFDEPCLVFINYNRQTVRYINPDKDWNSLYNQTLKNSEITMPDTCTRPTFSQAFRWFREKYGWIAEIHGSLHMNNFYANLLFKSKGEFRIVANIKMCDTYEEAENVCLDKLIEQVRELS